MSRHGVSPRCRRIESWRILAASALLLLLSAVSAGRLEATEVLHSNEWSNWTSVESAVWADPARDLEAADDFDVRGSVERILVGGDNSCLLVCVPPPVTGVWIRFWEWTPAGPGKLQEEYYLESGDPLFLYDPKGPDALDITLPRPFEAKGRHFLSTQLVFGEGFWWAIWVANHGRPSGSHLWVRDNLAGGGWSQPSDVLKNPLNDDLHFTLYGTPEGGSPVPEPVAGCGDWTAYNSPNPSLSEDARLRAVKVLAADDAWAVGAYSELVGGSNLDQFSLALHWDGKDWQQVPSPSPSPAEGLTWIDLNGVDGIASDDVWAAGNKNHYDSRQVYIGTHALVLHWDGAEWTEADIPIPDGGSSTHQNASGDMVYAIEAIAGDDVWFVGSWFEFLPSDAVVWPALAMHWDGSGFTVFDTPLVSPGNRNVMSAISAVASDDIWGVGSGGGSQIYHFDGSAWSHVPGPEPGVGNSLSGVVALASDDVWAGGFYREADGSAKPLMLHWDGVSWEQVATPAGGSMFAAWAPDDILTFGVNGFAHWDGVEWSRTTGLEHLAIPGASPQDMRPAGPCDLWAVGGQTVAGDRKTLTLRLEPTGGSGLDLDVDGVPDSKDNCVETFNPAQADCDRDNVGDACAVALGVDTDCNTNVFPDACDILEGRSRDTDLNRYPDECQLLDYQRLGTPRVDSEESMGPPLARDGAAEPGGGLR